MNRHVRVSMCVLEEARPSDLQNVYTCEKSRHIKWVNTESLSWKGDRIIFEQIIILTLTVTSEAIRKCPLRWKENDVKLQITHLNVLYFIRSHADRVEVQKRLQYRGVMSGFIKICGQMTSQHSSENGYLHNKSTKIFPNSCQICCNVFENLLLRKVKPMYDKLC